MPSWYQKRSPAALTASAAPTAEVASAWTYGAPASDTAHGSTTVTASAKRISIKDVKRFGSFDGWQEEAWSLYDSVGELHYVANAISGRMSQAEMYVEYKDKRLERDTLLAAITPQMVERLGLNLFVAGGGWLVGLPTESGTVKWGVFSTNEVTTKGKAVEISGEKYELDTVYVEKIWDSHPANWFEADSPVRAALPILRELVGLTMHISAQIDSRLAGAGVYWIPQEILTNAKVSTGEAGQQYDENPVLNAIMAAMMEPIQNRDSAMAVVPLLLGAPGDAIAKIRFDTFSTPFDANTKDLRDEAIRRLALSLDAPPELLLGMGESSHWNAWIVRDDVVQTHIKPRLDLIADALTTGFYRPILEAQGVADPENYSVKFDVSSLTQKPDMSNLALQLHAAGAISDEALLEATGFEETDAPDAKDAKQQAIEETLKIITTNVQLLDNAPAVYAAVYHLLDGSPESGPPPEPVPARVPRPLPSETGAPNEGTAPQ